MSTTPLSENEAFDKLSPFAKELAKDCPHVPIPIDILRTTITYAGDEYGVLMKTIEELEGYWAYLIR